MTDTPKPQLVIHIGDPKTGTTSIQHALSNGLVRCESLNILPWKNGNAVSLANGLKPKQDDNLRREPFENVTEWLTGNSADIAVISSEFFAWTKPVVLQTALRKHVPDYADTTRILGYVRPHASRFLAAYVQRTKAGRMNDDFDAFLDNVGNNNLLKYAERFGRWEKIFGAQFTLKPFIRSELRDGDIVADFFSEVLQGAPFEISGAVEENVSVTVQSLSGIRYIHECLGNADVEPRAHRILGEALANFFIPAEPVSGEKPRLDRKIAERLIDSYKEDARMLDAAFFDRPIMQDALESCAQDASDKPLDLTVGSYFSGDQIKGLESLSKTYADRIRNIRPLWAMHYNVRNGGLRPNPQQAQALHQKRKRLEEIDGILVDMAKIIRG